MAKMFLTNLITLLPLLASLTTFVFAVPLAAEPLHKLEARKLPLVRDGEVNSPVASPIHRDPLPHADLGCSILTWRSLDIRMRSSRGLIKSVSIPSLPSDIDTDYEGQRGPLRPPIHSSGSGPCDV